MPSFAFIVALFFASVCGQKEIIFRNCANSKDDAIKSIIATPCDTKPCRVRRGTDFTYDFRFISSVDRQNLTLDCTATGPFDITITVPGIERDFCKIVQCPLEKGKEYRGSMKVRIPWLPFAVDATVKMNVKADSDSIACFEFPVSLI